MSLAFSNTTNKNGIIQLIETRCGYNDGDITNNATRFAKVTAQVNLALDSFWNIALPASGTWQLDDSNFTDYPIITTNLVSGQRDYSFTVDGSSNLILDIYKVFVKDASGVYQEIFPVDVQSSVNGQTSSFTDGLNTTGVPTRYDKTANGIFLDSIPSYNSTAGLKIYINREASYFTVADTTKKPGCYGLFHEYFVLKPSYNFAVDNNLPNIVSLRNDIMKMERDIEQHYQGRNKDESKGFRTVVFNTQ